MLPANSFFIFYDSHVLGSYGSFCPFFFFRSPFMCLLRVQVVGIRLGRITRFKRMGGDTVLMNVTTWDYKAGRWVFGL